MNIKKYLSLIIVVTLLVSLFSGVIITATENTNMPQTTGSTDKTAKKEPANSTDTKASQSSKSADTGKAASTGKSGTSEGETAQIDSELVEKFAKYMKGVTPNNKTIDSDFTKVCENEYLALYAIIDNSKYRMGEILVYDKKTGLVWRSNPIDQDKDAIGMAAGHAYYRTKSQLYIQYAQGYNYFNLNSYYSCVKNNLVTSQVLEDGVKFTFKLPDLNFTIPVKYSLDGDSFKAEVLLNDSEFKTHYTVRGKVNTGLGDAIEQNIDYNITEIKLLPSFGASSYNENGYMFIPDGSGALIYFNNGKTNASQPYSQPIYGAYKESKASEFSGASERYYMPVFGMVRTDSKNAIMGVVEDNASVGYVNAEVSGYESAYNKVYSSYLNKIIKRETDTEEDAQPVSDELRDKSKNYSVKYYFLSGNDASYVGMAKRYRQYLLDKGMKKSENLKDGGLFFDMYAGVEKKTSILGFPCKVFDVKTTFEDIRNIADDMSNAGINNLTIKYSDWIKASGRKKVQSKVSFESSIGGKKEFLKTEEYLKTKGVGFFPNIDFINFADSGRGFNRFFDSVKFTSQAPAYQQSNNGLSAHINLGARWNLLKADKVQEASNKYLEDYKDLGAKGISLEIIGKTVYSDGSKDGITRGKCTDIWENIIKNYNNSGIEVMTTEPNAYAILNSDILLSVPATTTYVELADEAVPFYQIVVRGCKTYVSESVNLSSDPEKMVLNAIETGSGLLYSFVAGDTTTLKETYLKYLYSCNYSEWKDDVIKTYTDYKKVADQISGADIANHEILAEGVRKTTYSNGVSVCVNYNNNDVSINGVVIPGRGYKVERGQ
ncbi:MAG: DUF5696 domain-containing protein [Bacillota bacterium]|nr:DUF5696 domain-containing protein [Bacillota bacterium]